MNVEIDKLFTERKLLKSKDDDASKKRLEDVERDLADKMQRIYL